MTLVRMISYQEFPATIKEVKFTMEILRVKYILYLEILTIYPQKWPDV